ncbi:MULTISPECIES: ABC transporter substrate-binding protein [unclassified Nonomuraea]|uniref:ABC transporter substrate-binding protein n=1 Tax=unclassified Nonomuraea TaxID=2593643 RepID=UPI0033CE7A01
MTWFGEQLAHIADDMPERDLAARAIEAHQRRRRTLMALSAAVVVVVTVLAATVGVRALPGEPRAAVRPAQPPERSVVKVGVVPSVESAPVFVALEKGYFREEGLTVQPRIVSGAAAAAPELAMGALDLAQTDYATLFQANEHGQSLRIVASLHRAGPGTFAIAVNPGSRIRTAADLRKKRIAVPNLAGLGRTALAAVLKRARLTFRDVLLVERPYPEMLIALEKGQADAALLAEPYVTIGRASGRARIVQDAMTGEFANLYTAGMSATDRWTRANPRTLAAFRRALAKAQALIAADPRQARDVLARYTRITGTAAADVAIGSYPARLDLAELRRVADLARVYGLLGRPADLADAVAEGG